jgi:GDP-L-fucose synthase
MSKILITGGSGLVGSSFESGIKLSSKELNLLDYNQSLEVIKQSKPKSIIHCAAVVGGLYNNMSNPAIFFDNNIAINSNILKISKIIGVKKFIGFLSTCIFPDQLGRPLIEDDLHLGPPHKSNFAYAYAKRMLDVQVESYNQQYNTEYFNVIPTNIYGPNDNFNIENGHVIPALIHKTYLAKKNNKPLVIYGSGIAKREFIFSKDLSKICTQLMECYNSSKPIIISNSEEEISIKKIVDIITNIFQFDGEIIYDKTKSDGQLRKNTDNSRLKSVIKDLNFTSIENGLKITIDWFVNNYEKARK